MLCSCSAGPTRSSVWAAERPLRRAPEWWPLHPPPAASLGPPAAGDTPDSQGAPRQYCPSSTAARWAQQQPLAATTASRHWTSLLAALGQQRHCWGLVRRRCQPGWRASSGWAQGRWSDARKGRGRWQGRQWTALWWSPRPRPGAGGWRSSPRLLLLAGPLLRARMMSL